MRSSIWAVLIAALAVWAPALAAPPAHPPPPAPQTGAPQTGAPQAGAPQTGAPPAATPAHPPAPPAAAPTPAKPEGTPATVIDDQKVETVIGRHVSSSHGDDMGPIVNVIVNGHGQVQAALIDFGGFLGVGNRRIAVDWRALHFAAKGDSGRITIALTRDQIRLAPAYKPGQPLFVLGGPKPPPTMGSGAAGPGGEKPPPGAPQTSGQPQKK
jgi:hypothetical protein